MSGPIGDVKARGSFIAAPPSRNRSLGAGDPRRVDPQRGGADKRQCFQRCRDYNRRYQLRQRSFMQVYRKLIKRCAGCHAPDFDKGGPRLRGILNRKAGTVKDFLYSDALRESGIYWDENWLNRWLEN